MAKLFIVGFPRDMEEIEMVEIFSIHGIVNTVTIVTDQSTGESKGYGFIMMANQAGTNAPLQLLTEAKLTAGRLALGLLKRSQTKIHINKLLNKSYPKIKLHRKLHRKQHHAKKGLASQCN